MKTTNQAPLSIITHLKDLFLFDCSKFSIIFLKKNKILG